MHKLEKLNASIDIIPLQGSSIGMDQSNATRRPSLKSMDKVRMDEQPGKMFRDPMIISRVKTYLYENEDKVYIDVTEMADYLQRKYRDYRGKKRGPFRAMVRRAYDEITENLTRQVDPHWQDDEDEIDIESDPQVDPVPIQCIPSFNRPMGGRQNGNSSDKELIDISSDDDGGGKTGSSTVAAKPKHDDRRMDIEMTQVSKRPHLSPSIEQKRTSMQQIYVDQLAKNNRGDKTRKRPREESTFDGPISKKRPKDLPVIKPITNFADVGGNAKVLETVANLLVHMKHPEVYTKLGIAPPRGFLLHGPPGCGKTLLAHAIAGELKMPLLKVAAPELVAGVSGESEQRIRELFDQAIAIAPCILFLDEIDSVAPHRATAQKEMERRIVSQLLSCLDELGQKENGNKVLVLGATNRPDSIDPALRRAGRFDREVSLGIPDRDARAAILKVHTANVTLAPEISLQKIASLTPGFVGADLVALIREAAMAAVNRTFDDLKKKASVINEDVPIETPPVEEEIVEDNEVIPDIVVEPEPEVTDVIIEEPSAEKTDATEVEESQKADENPEPTEPDEKEKKSEEVSEPQEEPVSEKPATEEESKPDEEQPVTEESKKLEEETSTPEEPTTTIKVTEPQAETVEPAIESIVSMQVEELRKDEDEEIKKDEPGKKLEEILSWLHNEPPLTHEQLALLCVIEQDFEVALKNVQPSAKREGFATVPDVTWDDIGSLQDIRQELQMSILAPIRHAEHFASLGLTTPTGVLLCGPPGCGKTLLAKAIANEAGINFISVKGPELLNMYVGESEKAVRQCFMRARNSAPCVIFFDELDALCPKRSEGDSTATSRVVNQMLTEMDGVEGRKDVYLMAASNRPDIIDPAVLRPGRLDKILYVGLPSAADRVDILRALTKNGTKPKLAHDVDLEGIARSERCDGFTGADLASLVRESGIEALREIMSGVSVPSEICARHVDAAFDKIRPSVQEKDIKHYEKLQKLYSVKKFHNTDVPMTEEPTLEAMET